MRNALGWAKSRAAAAVVYDNYEMRGLAKFTKLQI
jgi:hypothetical protein